MANPDNTGKRMPTILRKGLYRNTLEDQDGKEIGRIGNVFAVAEKDETEEAAFFEALRDEIALRYRIRLAVQTFQNRADLLQYYLDLNAGGTPHSAQEIERVSKLRDEALAKGLEVGHGR